MGFNTAYGRKMTKASTFYSLATMLAISAIVPGAEAAQMPSNTVNGEVVGSPDLVQKACAEGQVVFYTQHSESQANQIAAIFQKSFPCIKVLVVSAVGGRITERVLNEVQTGKSQGDVLMSNDMNTINILEQKKWLRSWTPPSADKYPDGAKQQGVWYAGASAIIYPVYNTDLVKPEDAPKTWKDLLDPKWKGKIAAPDVALGGTSWMQYFFFRKKYGDDFIRLFAAQKPTLFLSDQTMTLAVARGEFPIGLLGSPSYSFRVDQGAPLKNVYPADGVIAVPDAVMLPEHSPHPNAAELFGNWYLSKEGQTAEITIRGIWSFRKDLPMAAKQNPPATALNFWHSNIGDVLANYKSLINVVQADFAANKDSQQKTGGVNQK